MRGLSPNLRGILLMVMATAAFTVNDTFLKLAMSDLPPFEALFLRGIASSLWGIPLLAFTGNLRRFPLVFNPRVQFRNLFELVAVLGFVLALAYAPIADVTAISQLSPMMVLVGAALFFGERMKRLQLVLVGVAFIGALMVAQPGASGFSVFALLGFWNAAACAIRDLVGRRVDPAVPGLVVAMGAGLVVLVGAGIATFLFEDWQMPSLTVCALIACSGLFLMFGHFFLFNSYRTATMGMVVPFLYMATIWALISGVLVFQTVPNLLAFAGIALILVSGVIVVMAERWQRKAMLVAPIDGLVIAQGPGAVQ